MLAGTNFSRILVLKTGLDRRSKTGRRGGSGGGGGLQVGLSITAGSPGLLEQGLCMETVPVCSLHWAKLNFSRLRWGIFFTISAWIRKLPSNQMSGALPFPFLQGASMFNSSGPSCLSHFLTHSRLGVKKEWGLLFKSLWFYTVLANRSVKLHKECW